MFAVLTTNNEPQCVFASPIAPIGAVIPRDFICVRLSKHVIAEPTSHSRSRTHCPCRYFLLANRPLRFPPDGAAAVLSVVVTRFAAQVVHVSRLSRRLAHSKQQTRLHVMHLPIARASGCSSHRGSGGEGWPPASGPKHE